MSLSKRIRFEVFKRDSFTCQYCGKKAPDVVLHVDHVHPRADGGGDDLLNLVTACVACNLGKGARQLSDLSVVERQRQQLDELQERKEQLEMMLDWQRGLLDLDSQQEQAAADFWSELLNREYSLTDNGRDKLRALIRRFGLDEVLEGMRIAVSTYVRRGATGDDRKESVELALDKVGGICHNRKKWKADPRGEVLDRGFRRFVSNYRDFTHYPGDGRLRRWWTDSAIPIIPADADAVRVSDFASRLVDACREEYVDGGYGAYWDALQSLDPATIRACLEGPPLGTGN